MDEIASPAEEDSSAEPSGAAARRVRSRLSRSCLNQRQPRAADLLPVRPSWVVVPSLIGLTGIAAIEAIHVHAATLPQIEGAEHLASLNAGSPGSLAAWYASAMSSAAAAAMAAVVFGIRAHRIDDYRGHYRIWLWTAAALTWMSLGRCHRHSQCPRPRADARHGQVVSTSLDAGCTLTWIAVYTLNSFGGLGLRLVVELWHSRLSLTALLVAGFLYFDAALFELQMLQLLAALISGFVESSWRYWLTYRSWPQSAFTLGMSCLTPRAA